MPFDSSPASLELSLASLELASARVCRKSSSDILTTLRHTSAVSGFEAEGVGGGAAALGKRSDTLYPRARAIWRAVCGLTSLLFSVRLTELYDTPAFLAASAIERPRRSRAS